jgi:hypothetical protein
MTKALLDQLFALEPADTSAADSTRLRLPTLEERVELYLHAIYGEREFTREEYLRARNIILDEMATQFKDNSVVGSAEKPAGLFDNTAVIGETISREGLHGRESAPRFAEAALQRGHAHLVREDRAQTVHLSHPLLTPSAEAVQDDLFTVKVEKARAPRRQRSFDLGSRISSFLSSRTLAWSATAAAVAILAVGILVKEQGERPAEPPMALDRPSTPMTSFTPQPLQTAAAVSDEKIAALVAGGRQLIVAGDIPNARLVLQLAAEVGNATAALELGATYDPTILQQQKAEMANINMARLWYEKAKDLGSTEAALRLERLRSVPSLGR